MDVSRTVFEILTLKAINYCFPTPPLFDAPARVESIRISERNISRKNKRVGLLYGECVIILTSNRFWLIHLCDGQTDGRTDGR